MDAGVGIFCTCIGAGWGMFNVLIGSGCGMFCICMGFGGGIEASSTVGTFGGGTGMAVVVADTVTVCAGIIIDGGGNVTVVVNTSDT